MIGTLKCVRRLLKVGILKSSNGSERMAVIRTPGRVCWLLEMVIWQPSNGPERIVVIGTLRRVCGLLEVGIWQSSNGQERTDALRGRTI